jgi:hypothetical protein
LKKVHSLGAEKGKHGRLSMRPKGPKSTIQWMQKFLATL